MLIQLCGDKLELSIFIIFIISIVHICCNAGTSSIISLPDKLGISPLSDGMQAIVPPVAIINIFFIYYSPANALFYMF